MKRNNIHAFFPWSKIYIREHQQKLSTHLDMVQQLVYVTYVHMPIFIGIRMILDMRKLTSKLIFFLRYSFQNFSSSDNFMLLKNLLQYIWPLIYLFDLGWDTFFTVYICFKETLFNFSYKLFNNFFSLPPSNCQFRASVRKYATIVMQMYVIFIILY